MLAKPGGASSPGYLWATVSREGAFAFPGLAPGKYEMSIAVGKRYDAMRWFEARRSAVAMGVLELGAPRTQDLTVRAADLLR